MILLIKGCDMTVDRRVAKGSETRNLAVAKGNDCLLAFLCCESLGCLHFAYLRESQNSQLVDRREQKR